MIESSGIERHGEFKFSVDGQAETVAREFSAAARGHGISLCRGGRFASIDIAAAVNSMRQRSSEPHSL